MIAVIKNDTSLVATPMPSTPRPRPWRYITTLPTATRTPHGTVRMVRSNQVQSALTWSQVSSSRPWIYITTLPTATRTPHGTVRMVRSNQVQSALTWSQVSSSRPWRYITTLPTATRTPHGSVRMVRSNQVQSALTWSLPKHPTTHMIAVIKNDTSLVATPMPSTPMPRETLEF